MTAPLDDLDPQDWPAFRQQCHDALDTALDYLQQTRARKVWQPVPAAVKARFESAAPKLAEGVQAVRDDIERDIMPYATGNTHPRFFGWVHGSGTASSLLADIYASAMNANLGGRDHAPIYVERQVVRWCCDLFDLPENAGGLLVTGTSGATLLALAAARHRALGEGARAYGLQYKDAPSLVGYASSQVHECAKKAFELLGLGSEALRSIAVDAEMRMDVQALAEQLRNDLADGHTPFCLVGSAGTVNTGAVDPLQQQAEFAKQHGLWFHVDGAFGALAVLAPSRKSMLRGIESADSIAFDFHKWMHVQYDAGCILVRDQDTLMQTFGARPDYLMSLTRGLAAGDPWFSELGIDLSRGFRALKVWSTIKAHGTEALGRAIERNCDQALYVAKQIDATQNLRRLAPVSLNIVCFRFEAEGIDEETLEALNQDIVADLQETGIAAPSTTRIDGTMAIRVNLTNHRTRNEDLDQLLDAVVSIGEARRIAMN